jgi:hypothetical protein
LTMNCSAKGLVVVLVSLTTPLWKLGLTIKMISHCCCCCCWAFLTLCCNCRCSHC